MFELVESGVKGPVADLEVFVGHLAEALGDGPSGSGLEIKDLEDEEEEGALQEGRWPAHGSSFQVTEMCRLHE
jgi:hypothetical protein